MQQDYFKLEDLRRKSIAKFYTDIKLNNKVDKQKEKMSKKYNINEFIMDKIISKI